MENFPRYRPFVRGINRSTVDIHQQGQWRRVLMFSLICAAEQTVEQTIKTPVIWNAIALIMASLFCGSRWWSIPIGTLPCSLYNFVPILKFSSKSVNTLWLLSCHRTWSTLVRVMASCLTAPSHCLKQYWHTINMILWFSFHDNIYLNTLYNNTQVLWNLHVWNLSNDFITFWVHNALFGRTRIRVCSMSADALVSVAAGAPVDIMLLMCILQIRSFHWCRFLSYSSTVCMPRNVRKFSLPCMTRVTWTNLSNI